MSYDTYLNPPKHSCETCKREFERVYGPDPTYNLTPIFDLALTGESFPNPEVSEGQVVILKEKTTRPRGLRLLNGRVASETITDLQHAIIQLQDPTMAPAFIALEPPNKWGDFPGALRVMKRLLELAEAHPTYVWEVH